MVRSCVNSGRGSRRPVSGGEKEASKTEKRATDRRNWRLLIENVLRER